MAECVWSSVNGRPMMTGAAWEERERESGRQPLAGSATLERL